MNKELIDLIKKSKETVTIGLKEVEEIITKALALDYKERKTFLNTIDLATAKRIMECLPKLTYTLCLLDGSDYEERVKRRYKHINDNPGKCYWDYIEYQHYNVDKLDKFNDILVSNTGVLIRIDKTFDKLSIRNVPAGMSGNYLEFKVLKNLFRFSIHRAVGSTFIPKPKRHQSIPHSKLYINHKDKNIYNNDVSNLEWTTCKENTLHGMGKVDYHNPVLFVFRVDNNSPYDGVTFVAEGHEIGKKVMDAAIRTSIKKRLRIKGLRARVATEEDLRNYPTGVPSEIKAMLESH